MIRHLQQRKSGPIIMWRSTVEQASLLQLLGLVALRQSVGPLGHCRKLTILLDLGPTWSGPSVHRLTILPRVRLRSSIESDYRAIFEASGGQRPGGDFGPPCVSLDELNVISQNVLSGAREYVYLMRDVV